MQSSANNTTQTRFDEPEATPFAGRLLDCVFSLPTVCIMVVMLLVFGISERRLVESDIWWHLRNGQQIVQHHSIPHIDTYSFGAAGSPWLDHEWLSEVLFYLGFKAWALRGVVLVYSSVLVLLYAGLYFLTCSAGADYTSALLATLLAVLLGMVSIGPRMLLFGWLCMIGLLLVLNRFRRTGKGLWLLPPLFAVWINLHGSWVFGLAVLAVIIAAGLVEGDWGLVVARRWTPAELKALSLGFAGAVAALFVNPFGYKLPLYPFDLLFRQQSVMKYLEEWQSVNFGKGSGRLALITLIALLVAALFSRRRWRLDEVCLLIFGLWTGLSHVRMLFFLGLIAVPILAPRLDLFPPQEGQRNRPWLNAAIIAAMTAWLVFSFPTPAELQRQVNAELPTAALDFMQRQHIAGRVFNQDWWGGYMEWQMPALKPFMDGRTDIFVYNGSFDDYLSIVQIRRPFELLDKYGIEYVLIEPNQPVVYVLNRFPDWQVIYSDNVAVVLARSP